ncbi:MAG TPA: transposase [Acetobacteraceae bacterium]|nr:transposase [Acetobacteraceae bacterium]
MEIITGVERRRRWRLEEKLRIVAEAEAPGACFAAVARRHEISRGLLWNWRRQVRTGALGPAAAAFLPVRIVPGQTAPAVAAAPAVASRQQAAGGDTTIEIALPDGTTVRVGRDVGAVALRRVLGALRR